MVRKAAAVKNSPMSRSVPAPPVRSSAAIQTSTKTSVVATSLTQEKRAWAGGGVSSSISAGPYCLCAVPWPPPPLNFAGMILPPMMPRRAAASTTQGKSTL